jgi:hypothetical protein
MTSPRERDRVLEAVLASPWPARDEWPRIAVVLRADGEILVRRRAWVADEARRGRRELAHAITTARVADGCVLVVRLSDDGQRADLDVVRLEEAPTTRDGSRR